MWDVPGADGDDDPVVGAVFGGGFGAVAGGHPDVGVAGGVEVAAGGGGDVGVDVEGGHLAGGAGQGGEQGGVVARSGPDLQDAVAGLDLEGVEHGRDDGGAGGAAQVGAVGEGVGD